MGCHIICDACSLDEVFEDCVTAHEEALNHEQEHPDHFVSLRNPA